MILEIASQLYPRDMREFYEEKAQREAAETSLGQVLKRVGDSEVKQAPKFYEKGQYLLGDMDFRNKKYQKMNLEIREYRQVYPVLREDKYR